MPIACVEPDLYVYRGLLWYRLLRFFCLRFLVVFSFEVPDLPFRISWPCLVQRKHTGVADISYTMIPRDSGIQGSNAYDLFSRDSFLVSLVVSTLSTVSLVGATGSSILFHNLLSVVLLFLGFLVRDLATLCLGGLLVLFHTLGQEYVDVVLQSGYELA